MIKWINAIAFSAMIALNGIANYAKLGGNSTGGVSDAYANIFTPAPWTFAIWGMIYALLLIYIFAPFIKPDGYTARLSDTLGLWFAISCILNMVWLLTWHYNHITASWITMLALLGTLVIMFVKFTYPGSNSLLQAEKGLTWGSAGLTIYLAWICIATVANTMVLLVSLGADGYGMLIKALSVIVLIAVAFIIAMTTVMSENWLFGLAAVWAYVGVLQKQISTTENGALNTMSIAAIIGILIIAAGIFIAIPKGVNTNGIYNGKSGDVLQ